MVVTSLKQSNLEMVFIFKQCSLQQAVTKAITEFLQCFVTPYFVTEKCGPAE